MKRLGTGSTDNPTRSHLDPLGEDVGVEADVVVGHVHAAVVQEAALHRARERVAHDLHAQSGTTIKPLFPNRAGGSSIKQSLPGLGGQHNDGHNDLISPGAAPISH